MREIVLTNEAIKELVIVLGHCGDTGNLTYKFDFKEFFKDKNTKNALLILNKPDGTKATVDLDVVDDMPVWPIGTDVTDVSGNGAYQITVDDGENTLSSEEGRYFVGNVLERPVEPEPPVTEENNTQEGE